LEAGQTRICASRRLVQASIYDEFVARLKVKTETIIACVKSVRVATGDQPFDGYCETASVAAAEPRRRK
jgi:acyl-CoA reductase-like NAD-dependent aldehyde dehydrogenase